MGQDVSGVIIDRLSHALLAHRMAQTGRGVAELPSIIEATTAVMDGGLVAGMGSLKLATDRTKRAGMYRRTAFIAADGGVAELPALATWLRRDGDGDIVMEVREIGMASGARVRRRTLREPFEVLLPHDLPDTLMAAIAGRPLAEIAAHPATDALGLVIERSTRLDATAAGDLILPDALDHYVALELRRFGKTVIHS